MWLAQGHNEQQAGQVSNQGPLSAPVVTGYTFLWVGSDMYMHLLTWFMEK